MVTSTSKAIFFGADVFAASMVAAQDVADTLFRGGTILTINDPQPRAEVVALKYEGTSTGAAHRSDSLRN